MAVKGIIIEKLSNFNCANKSLYFDATNIDIFTVMPWEIGYTAT